MENQTENQIALHLLKLLILVILGFAFMMLVFGAGIWVGQKRAEFSLSWAQSYHGNFGGLGMQGFKNFPEQDFINSHGIFGQILEIDNNIITIKDQDGAQRTVVISAKTVIRNNSTTIKLSDIKINDSVVIIGAPDNQGQLQAEFIRVFLQKPSTFFYIRSIKI